MKRIWVLGLLLVVGIAILAFVMREKKVLEAKKERNKVVESTDVSVVASASSTSSSSLSEFQLRVLTEPEKADIYIDEEKVGVSPYELPIPAESKKMRVEAPGYETYRRQIPAARDAEGDLVWKIQLKKTSLREELPAKTFTRGIVGPFNVQLKAVPYLEFNSGVVEEFERGRPDGKPKYCKVQIAQKVWVRILLGPYGSKARAQKTLRDVQANHPQAFFTQKQNCL